MDEKKGIQNIFWPVLLIAVGGLFLLANFGVIESFNLILLLRLWPLLLVSLGMRLLIPKYANLVSILLVLGAVVYLIAAPALGYEPTKAALITEDFKEPLDNAQKAVVHLDIDRGGLTVAPLDLSTRNIIEVTATHDQIATLTSTGREDKDILFELDVHKDLINFFDFEDLFNQVQIETDVQLNPTIPLDLLIELGAGSADLDLSALTLTNLDAGTGSGKLTVKLPSGEFPIDLGAGSGSLTISASANSLLNLDAGVGSGQITLNLAEGVQGEVEVDSGSGRIMINVPAGIGLQITGSTGSGSVQVPSNFIRTQGSDEIGPSKSGTWESPGFDDAEFQVHVRFSVGSGSIFVEIE
ncbi:MAG: DUF4097 domain-containing protein [Chloroflexota bacterium]